LIGINLGAIGSHPTRATKTRDETHNIKRIHE
jgi:hypothetical protein